MYKLPIRLAQIHCDLGKHEWKITTTRSYEKMAEGYKVCKVCGKRESWAV